MKPRSWRISILILLLALTIVVSGARFLFPTIARFQDRVFEKAVIPPLSFVRALSDHISGWFRRYFFLTHVAGDNETLKRELSELKLQLYEQKNITAENQRLRELLDYSKKSTFKFIAAKVLAYDPVLGSKTLLIDRGSEDGVERGLGVLTPHGVVGVIDKVNLQSSLVILMIDPLASVAVETDTHHVRGVLTGYQNVLTLNREFWLTRVEYLNAQEKVIPQEKVYTSGLDQVFPEGIPVGMISSLEKDSKGLFLNAVVVPFVDFSQLKEVLIMKPKK